MISLDDVTVRPLRIAPVVPEALSGLVELSGNYLWVWRPTSRRLFERLDKLTWQAVAHNPVRLLKETSPDAFARAAADPKYVADLAAAVAALRAERARPAAFAGEAAGSTDGAGGHVAYFSAEFGVHESLPIYSGGLGILAGDHLKSASDLNIPLVGVGLLYRSGYFEQRLAANGWQEERFPEHDFGDFAVELTKDDAGRERRVEVNVAGQTAVIRIWRADIGRVPLYLLDTDVSENPPAIRNITARLYGTGTEVRIAQEIVLGIGGVRALRELGVPVDVYHMNEGHAAFLALERVRHRLTESAMTFDEARQHVMATNVFTTHTPVPAGIDQFSPGLMAKYFRDFWPTLKLDEDGFLALGREDVTNAKQGFSMAVLAIRLADTCNGVSKLHGDVSRQMWRSIWPKVPAAEVPIRSITNGVHTPSWISDAIGDVVGHDCDFGKLTALSDADLWQVREASRASLVTWVRRIMHGQRSVRLNTPPTVIDRLLDPKALTIGFARRFATYKRGTLLLRDLDRLRALVGRTDRPVQFVFAGKAHPADEDGKRLIQAIATLSRDPAFRERFVFIENYDIHVARRLVQGVDVWLNTPRRPHEASGTSGMKAAANGVLNCSVLDGWWVEGYALCPHGGWAIGGTDEYPDTETQDRVECDALYDLLEHQIVPAFYDRNAAGLPDQWLKRMRACVKTLAEQFSTGRMVSEYAEQLYLPAVRRGRTLDDGRQAAGMALAHNKDRLRSRWGGVRIDAIDVGTATPAPGEGVDVEAVVNLAGLSPTDVRVEVLVIDADDGGLDRPLDVVPLSEVQVATADRHVFAGRVVCRAAGRHGLAIRVVPNVPNLATPFEPGLIRWA